MWISSVRPRAAISRRPLLHSAYTPFSVSMARAYSSQPRGTDFYDVIGMPISTVPANGWRVDQNDLKAKWRRTMAVLHPDKLVHKSPEEQERGAQESAIVNKAYETLKSPLLRALYLLERNGVESVEEGMSVENAELLMEVMELQEGLQDAEDRETVEQVGAANDQHLQSVLGKLDKAFAAPSLDLDNIRQLAVELRYWTNIDKAVREWQPGQRVELHH